MLSRKIAYNTIISAGARIIGLALSLIIIGLMTRYLGEIGFGYYSTILAFLYFFTVLADLGLYSICLREISRPGADQAKVASNSFTLRFFVGLLIFLFAPLVGYLFPYVWEIKAGILIGAIGFWLMSSQQVLMGVFQKYLRMDRVALAELISRSLQLGLVVLLISQKLGFLFFVWAMTIAAFFNFFLIFWFSRRYLPISFRFDFLFWRELLKEAWPLGLASIFVMIYFKLDTVMLSLMKGPADVGIYGLAYKILESLLFFPAMFVGLVMPLLSETALANRASFKKISQKTLDVLLMFVVPMVIGVIFLSPRIISLIGGSHFSLSAGVLNILIMAAGIIFLAILFSNMIIALKKQKSLTYIYALGAAVNFGANLILIPKYSFYGAASTTLLAELLTASLMLVVLYRALKYLPSFRTIFQYGLAGLVMALLLYWLGNLNLFVLMGLAILVYFGCLFLMGGFSAKEVFGLIRKENIPLD